MMSLKLARAQQVKVASASSRRRVEVPATGSWTRGLWRSVYRRFRLAIECSGRVTAHSETARWVGLPSE
jgi:hypothetical protein